MKEFYNRTKGTFITLLNPREKYNKAKAEVEGNCHLTNTGVLKDKKKLTKQEKAWRQGYRTAFLDMIRANKSRKYHQLFDEKPRKTGRRKKTA